MYFNEVIVKNVNLVGSYIDNAYICISDSS